ncbi:MAG: hypothetical protein KDE20_23695, partial [Caldilineaceae bacterium]|nr:hypothetical protein [Caldilineaceae bacterium]
NAEQMQLVLSAIVGHEFEVQLTDLESREAPGEDAIFSSAPPSGKWFETFNDMYDLFLVVLLPDGIREFNTIAYRGRIRIIGCVLEEGEVLAEIVSST